MSTALGKIKILMKNYRFRVFKLNRHKFSFGSSSYYIEIFKSVLWTIHKINEASK